MFMPDCPCIQALAVYLDSAVLQVLGCHSSHCRVEVTKIGGDLPDITNIYHSCLLNTWT